MISPLWSFDDVLIVPNFSNIPSRSVIDISASFLGLDLKLPIISSNMDFVTESSMANAMLGVGGFYVTHRFYADANSRYKDWEKIKGPLSISVGAREDELLLETLYLDNPPSYITIDVAHGHHQKVADRIRELKNTGSQIIAGNVATADGARYLEDAGADAIKVGIGPGSVCTTREVTGVGVPQLSAIIDCAGAVDIPIIADGGIKNSGDIVKALAAGADMVMLGSLLAGTNEAPGEVRITPDGQRYKPYRGQSIFGVNHSHYTVEGVEGWVKERGSVADVLKQLAGGIRSGLSYVGARNLSELRLKAKFVQVTQATHLESGIRVQTSLNQ
jgi:IMP dehydrogenase